jgi:phosphoribosylformylglycinamidine synthase subunit PurSL
MPSRIEITLKPELVDAEGQGLRNKARNYFGVAIDSIRTVHIITIDADLSSQQLGRIQSDIFTNPVTQISSLEPLTIDCDWIIWVGFRPGVRDNAGATAMEAMADLLGISFKSGEAVYTSKRYCIKGTDMDRSQVESIASELLANDIIQQWNVFSRSDWDPSQGIGYIIPKVRLDHNATVTVIPIESEESLKRISDQRNLALNPNDIPTIRDYFLDPDVQRQRVALGLSDPTDVELEYISQARSDHCNHNTFQGRFH